MPAEILHVLLADAAILLVLFIPSVSTTVDALKMVALIGIIALLKLKYPCFSDAQKRFQKIAMIILAVIAVIAITVGLLLGSFQ